MNKLFAALITISLLALNFAIAEEIQFVDATAIEAPIDEIELVLGDDIEDIVPEEVTEIDLGEDLLADIGELTMSSDAMMGAIPNSSGVAIDETNFPDENFREYVSESFDTDGDGALSDAEREAVTEIHVYNKAITSLEGFRLFVNLHYLYCSNTQLTDLDVSGCTGLWTLNCNSNRLTSLNIDGCSNLSELNCWSNRLTNLDLSKIPDLHSLNCGGNELTKLDLSSCTDLRSLDCEGNRLARLDVSGCGALEELKCGLNGMTKLKIGDHKWLSSLECGDNALTELNLSGCPALEYLDCNTNQLSRLSVKGCQALRYLKCGYNVLKTLNVDGCSALVFLDCDQNQLESLDVSVSENLEELSCSGSQLTRLSVRACAKLNTLFCDDNLLTDLDLRECSALEWLDCNQNRLSRLDLGDCAALGWLCCERNQLTNLDISSNAKLSWLLCYGNSIPSLDITNCNALRSAWKNPKKTTRDGYKIICAGNTRGFFDSYGIEIDRATALIVDGKPIYGTLSLSDAVITVPDQTYTGKALKPAVTVKYGSTQLKAGTDYTVSYKDNKKIGTATVVIKGKGSYVGEKTASFNIVPKAVSGLKLKAGKKQLTISWKKVSGVTGYQLEYSLKKNFSSPKQVSVSKATTVKKTLKNLKKNKTYYVRIRAYKEVNGQTYWSAWSATKKAKVK